MSLAEFLIPVQAECSITCGAYFCATNRPITFLLVIQLTFDVAEAVGSQVDETQANAAEGDDLEMEG
jgi:hypothetical protein